MGQSSEALTNPSACTVVNIQDTLPLNWYTQGISVMHMSEILKNQSQMEDYIFKHNAIPAAFGLFPHLHEQKVIFSEHIFKYRILKVKLSILLYFG